MQCFQAISRTLMLCCLLCWLLFYAKFLVKENTKISDIFTWADGRLTDCYRVDWHFVSVYRVSKQNKFGFIQVQFQFVGTHPLTNSIYAVTRCDYLAFDLVILTPSQCANGGTSGLLSKAWLCMSEIIAMGDRHLDEKCSNWYYVWKSLGTRYVSRPSVINN